MSVEIGKEWPPKADRHRLALYDRYQKFFRGEHHEAFRYLGARSDMDKDKRVRKIALIMNYPALITKGCTDILCGEAPKFVVNSDTQDAKEVQAALSQLVRDSRFESVLYAAQTVNSYRGDAVFRVRDNGARVVIEQIPAHNYFVELDPDNQAEVVAQCVAWVREGEKGMGVLRVEHHTAGQIINEAYSVKYLQGQRRWEVRGQIDLAEVYPEGDGPAEVQFTGIDRPLLWHVPNFYDGESYWGLSDYGGGLDTLFEAANNRLSKIDSYLDRHQRPILVGIPGMSDTEGKVDSREDYVEPPTRDDGKDLPRYVTWDGQMTAAFEELQELKRQIRCQSETPKRLLGESEDTSIDSGRAMLNDFIPITKKVNRKRTLVDPVVKEVLFTALTLHHLRYQGPDPTGFAVDVKWQDGIPQDYMESVQTEAARVQNGLSSKQSAIERIDVCTPEEALAEIDRIHSETESQASPGESPPAMAGESGVNAGPRAVTGAAANTAPGARYPYPGTA